LPGKEVSVDLPDPADERRARRELVWFFVASFAVAWPLWLAGGVFEGPAPREILDARWMVAQLGVFVPSITALLIGAFAARRRECLVALVAVFVPVTVVGFLIARRAVTNILSFAAGEKWLLVAVAALVLLFFSPLNRTFRNPGRRGAMPPARPAWVAAAALAPFVLFLPGWALANVGQPDVAVTLLGGGPARATVALVLLWSFNLVFGGSLGEEIGWRGFALERLLERMSPVRASALLAVFWALWHAPIDVAFGFGLPGPGAVVVRLLWTLPLTMLFTWLFLRAGSSLLAPLALHTSFNVLPGLGCSRLEPAMAILFVAVLVVGFAAAVALSHADTAASGDGSA
jgi:hypothetical protein